MKASLLLYLVPRETDLKIIQLQAVIIPLKYQCHMKLILLTLQRPELLLLGFLENIKIKRKTSDNACAYRRF